MPRTKAIKPEPSELPSISRAIGLYDEALVAATNKDISGLSWALLRTSLEELNKGETPILGKTIVSDLLRNLSANVRKLRDVENEDKAVANAGDDIKKFLEQSK